MGFFSSKKSDETSFLPDNNDMSVVQAIRSRLYGKSKGKEREVISSPVISPGSPSRSAADKTLKSRNSVGLSKKDRPSTAPLPSTNGTKESRTKATTPNPPRPTTDAMTQTLAQRLNELATSNSEGLLNDEEYRLLRQNLFERFASGAVAPSEAPVVPLVHPSRRSSDGRASMSSSTQGRPSSQFHVNATRTPSLRTKASMTSTVTTLFRRSSRRRSASGPGPRDSSAASDASSVFSMNSSTSNAVRRSGMSRILSRKRSDVSVRTETDRSPYDASFSSRPTSAMGQSLSPDSVSRSATRSLRRLAAATPPSSYNARLSGTETIGPGLRPSSSLNVLDVFDDEHLQSAKDIRKEIEQVEAEGRRLMDAFNGLELSTLTRRQHRPARLPSIVSPSSDGSRSRDGREGTESSTWASTPDRKRHFRDLDALSIRSNTSAGTSLSAAKSQASNTRLRTVPGANKSVAILRKSSLSSVSSRANSVANGLPPMPPLPPTSPSLGHLGVGSTSSVNLARSSNHLPLSALAESEIVDRRSFAESRLGIVGDPQEDADLTAMEGDLADIRKRRGEVTARYETRLEFLRAKLKGAELHEKLLRK